MKVLIEIDEGLIDSLKNGSFGIKYNTYDLCGAVANGIPLEGTNGEVLKAVFPESDGYEYAVEKDLEIATMFVFKDEQAGYMNFDLNWWNADYKEVE